MCIRDRGQLVTLNVVNDAPSNLHARRLMMSYLYDLKYVQRKDEDKSDWKERTKDVKYPVVEKLFRGASTTLWLAFTAFLILVRKSAIGSVMIIRS